MFIEREAFSTAFAGKRTETVLRRAVLPYDGTQILFSSLLRRWQEDMCSTQKASTQWRYEYLIWHHIAPQLGNYTIAELNEETLDAFVLSKLQSGGLRDGGKLSPAYVRSMITIINAALRYAEREKYCTRGQILIQKPHIWKKEVTVLTVAEQKMLEGCLMGTMSLSGLGVLLSLNTGLRIGEVCALTWKSVDLENHILSVTSTVSREKGGHGKGNLAIRPPKTSASFRTIPIPSKLHRVLSSMQPNDKSDYLLSGKPTFVSPRTYEYRFHRLLEKCGIRSVNYHALRHTFATRCVELGMDIKTLSELLGHSNTAITLNTYVHSSFEHKRMQMELLSHLPD